jgi:hypothetical protein
MSRAIEHALRKSEQLIPRVVATSVSSASGSSWLVISAPTFAADHPILLLHVPNLTHGIRLFRIASSQSGLWIRT